MGGWGGQLHCEGCCNYGPGQQWRTPGYRAPQSLSSLSRGAEGDGGGGVQIRKKRQRLAERLAWPLRECKGERGECGRAQREKGQVWEVGGEGHQKVLCPKEYEGTCSSLLPHT